jgi:hypothetical protein
MEKMMTTENRLRNAGIYPWEWKGYASLDMVAISLRE